MINEGRGYMINEWVIQQVSPTFCRLVSVKTSFRAHTLIAKTI